jgi:hypothetical protein
MVGSHSSITLWSLSMSSITWLASSKCPPPPIPDSVRYMRCVPCISKVHKMDAMWEHTPTTRAPARHLQYHAVTSVGLYSIHKKYVLDDVWRLCNRTYIKWSSSWWTKSQSCPLNIPAYVAGTEFDLVNPTCNVMQLSLVEMLKVN